MSKIILVTGASGGFGKAIATKFAAGGWNLILTARRKEKLDELAKSLETTYGIKTLCLAFDIQDSLEQIKLLPSSNSLVLQGVGHMGMLEATDRVNHFIQQFIETT